MDVRSVVRNQVDELDRQIIDELRRDGRLANTEIARQLGVSEATIRSRIQRLISEDIIQVGARVNLSRVGHDLSVVIGVTCEPGRLAAVAEGLADMDEIRYVSCVTGRYHLLVFAFFRSAEDFLTFMTNQIGSVPGVSRIETLQELRIAKRSYGYWELSQPGRRED